MKCIMIFDNLNDIVYSKYDKKFAKYIRNVGKEQHFILDSKVFMLFLNVIYFLRAIGKMVIIKKNTGLEIDYLE